MNTPLSFLAVTYPSLCRRSFHEAAKTKLSTTPGTSCIGEQHNLRPIQRFCSKRQAHRELLVIGSINDGNIGREIYEAVKKKKLKARLRVVQLTPCRPVLLKATPTYSSKPVSNPRPISLRTFVIPGLSPLHSLLLKATLGLLHALLLFFFHLT